MSRNMSSKDVRTLGYVVRRTNYGEADRILNIITPLGKITAMAKGVRREKSKLAGGIEMFSLIDFNIHTGRGEFGVVTGAKMLKHYGEILKDYVRVELAGMMLKEVSRAAEGVEAAEYFGLVDQGLAGLNEGMNVRLVEGWFGLSMRRVMGEEVNLYADVEGVRLAADKRYEWDGMREAFCEREGGGYGADEIKLLRLMMTAELKMLEKVRMEEATLVRVMELMRMCGIIGR